MPLQSQVNLALAPGVAGDKATPDQSIYTPINYLAGEGGVSVGTFCWRGTDPGVAVGTTTGDAAPLGFVERVLVYPNYNVFEDATLIVPEGFGLTVAVKGDYWVEAGAAVTVEGQVYVDKTNGAILAAAGTNGIAATGWKFKTAGEAGDMVIISNW